MPNALLKLLVKDKCGKVCSEEREMRLQRVRDRQAAENSEERD